MSLIHLDKSLITFHFKEILEDGHIRSPYALIGLGALIFGSKLLSNLAKASSPAAKTRVKSSSPYRPHMSLSEWVANAKKQQQEASAIAVAKARVAESSAENTPATEKIAA